jgi:hypothetical protein
MLFPTLTNRQIMRTKWETVIDFKHLPLTNRVREGLGELGLYGL